MELLKNPDGQLGFQHWEIQENGGDHWIIETPPVSVSKNTTTNLVFSSAFVTSYGWCAKKQTVDLLKEGIDLDILDSQQPDITVSEWFAGRWDCGSTYSLRVELLNESKVVITKFEFTKELEDCGWEEVKHTFTSCGLGVRYIVFRHSGKDLKFWAGHYRSKMTNASITIAMPK